MSSICAPLISYRRALVYLPEADSRMLPTYKKLQETFDSLELSFPRLSSGCISPTRAIGSMPFSIRDEANRGALSPVVYNYGGADGILLRATSMKVPNITAMAMIHGLICGGSERGMG